MKKNILLTLLVSFLLLPLYASRPTSHASNLSITYITCNSLQINWTNGDGSARLIVGKEGSPSSWTPGDNTIYTSSPHFGSSAQYSGDSYVVYNSQGSNYVKIDSLKTGKTYYFTIFEHDNNGASTLYYTTGAPYVYETTGALNLDFSINTSDSCEAHNSFTFTNNSNSTIPGISYTFDFGDGNSSSTSPINHQYINKSGNISIRLKASPSAGCINTFTKTVRVYPKKVAYIDYSKFNDSQCLNGNYFEIDPAPLVSPLPKSFTYNWAFGDGTNSTYKKMKKTYGQSGHYKVELEIVTNVNVAPTGCRDTLSFYLDVLQNPITHVSISDSVQCINNNLFSFTNADSISNTNICKWYFGDNDSINAVNTKHSYLQPGVYNIISSVESGVNGCRTKDTFKVEVVAKIDPKFYGLAKTYCASNNKVTLTTTNTFGKFSGYPTNGLILVPNTPGNYVLKYTINLKNCSDSSSRNFIINACPQPALGRDTLISSSQNLLLNAGNAVKYLWNTGATTQTLLIDGSKAPKGTSRYTVELTNDSGCLGFDTILVSIDYISHNKDVKRNAFGIYPNPVTDVLTINNGGAADFEWTVMNQTGQQIMHGNQESQQLNFSNLANGLYILEIKNAEGIHQLKIIKL